MTQSWRIIPGLVPVVRTTPHLWAIWVIWNGSHNPIHGEVLQGSLNATTFWGDHFQCFWRHELFGPWASSWNLKIDENCGMVKVQSIWVKSQFQDWSYCSWDPSSPETSFCMSCLILFFDSDFSNIIRSVGVHSVHVGNSICLEVWFPAKRGAREGR